MLFLFAALSYFATSSKQGFCYFAHRVFCSRPQKGDTGIRRGNGMRSPLAAEQEAPISP